MRLFIINLTIVAFMTACHSQSTEPKVKDYHEVVVAEVLQANAYTYLRLTENESEHWAAVPKMQAEVGKTYYYKGGMLMTNFESKDLGRTFEEVYFLGGISTEPITAENEAAQKAQQKAAMPHGGTPQNTTATTTEPNTETGTHEIVVKEILQANKYTYLLGTENGADHWVALPKIEAEVGKTYYYSGGMLMTAFESKDLNRKFDEVYFINGVSEQPSGTQEQSSTPKGSTETEELVVEKIEQVSGGISIEELYSKIDTYGNKVVKIKGKVTKYNGGIMGKNWLHIQDGTQHETNMDLTVTTASLANVGDVITVEGKVTLNKDFGAGYFFEVIMEDAKISKN